MGNQVLRKIRSLTYRMGIVVLILYSVTTMIYIFILHKPFKPIPGESYELIITNEMLNTINREEIIAFLITSFLFCVIASIIMLLIYNELIFYFKPVREINARLKSKEAVVRTYVDPRTASFAGYNYVLTFEIEDGSEMTFAVIPKSYMAILEGNKGSLRYKEGMINRFVCFNIISIE